MTDAVFWLLCTCAAILTIILKLAPRPVKKADQKKNSKLTLSVVAGTENVILKTDELNGRQFEDEKRNKADGNGMTGKVLKGPRPLPIIGSLHLLRGPGGPFEAFTNLAKLYGDIYKIQLGVEKCVIVSSYDLVKEVLITKGNHFGGRPDFIRFHQLFSGDRNNCKYFWVLSSQ